MFFFFEYILLLYGTVIPIYALHVLSITDTFLTSILFGILFIMGILTVFIWKKLDVKLGSRKAYAIAVICFIVAVIPLFFISSFTLALVMFIIIGFGFGGMLYFIYLIIADVIDEDELKTGVRREGTFFGITNFFMRLAMVLSIVSVSLIFSSAGWETYTPNPGADVILGLRVLVVVFPILALIGTLICLYFYPFSKERVEGIKNELSEMHKKKLEKVRA